MNTFFQDLFEGLPSARLHHSPLSPFSRALKHLIRQEILKHFSEGNEESVSFPPFGNLIFPFESMGAIDSTCLFDYDELILFSYYWRMRNKYKHVADIGANIGLHSIILSRCGFSVKSYEPDPGHFSVLRRNLALNACDSNVDINEMAVSSQIGETEFVRVEGNSTGSHIAGSKLNPYGDLKRFPVRLESITPILEWADFIKLDAEGHEKEILLSTRGEQWDGTDAFVEIENRENAIAVFAHFEKENVYMFSQKVGWNQVVTEEDMPTSYKEGMLFISRSPKNPWDE